jgi:hypothetical protein
MKKILAALALLALVFGTVAAQDGELTVKGHVKTGFVIDGDEGTIAPYNDNAGRTSQAQLQFDYVTENSGVSVRFRADERSSFIPSPLPGSGHAYGWFNFLPDGIAQISGGILNNAKFGTFTDFWLYDAIDNQGYFKLAVTPIEGLTIGLTTFAIDMSGATDLEDAFQGSVIGAKYVVPDTLGVSAAFMFNAKHSNFRKVRILPSGQLMVLPNVVVDMPDGKPAQGLLGLKRYEGTGSLPDAVYAYGTFSTLFSAFYYGVENLKLDLDGYFGYDKEGAGGDSASTFGIGLQGNYQISEPLFAGARVVFELAEAHKDHAASLEIRPQAGYTVNDWLAFGLEVPIGLEGQAKGLEDATFIIGVAPKATFTLNHKAKLEAWYTLRVAKAKNVDDPAYTNTINLDLIWTF